MKNKGNWTGWLLLLGLLLVHGGLNAQHRVLVHMDGNRLAVSGYDTVAFFEEGRPVKGLPTYQVLHEGAAYWFSSAKNRSLFMEDPERYKPEFGGFCAVSLSRDILAGGDPTKYRVIENKLYLLHDEKALEQLDKEKLAQSARRWEQKVERYGTPYVAAGITR